MNIEPVLMSPEPVDAEISALVKRLNSDNETKVRAAIVELCRRGDAGIEALLTALTTQEQRRKRNKRRASFWGHFFALLMLACCTRADKFSALVTFLSVSTVVGFFVSLSLSQKHGVKWLAQLEDVRAVGVLTEALQWKNAEIRASAMYGLTLLLPRVKQSDAKSLTLKHRQILLSQFNRVEPSSKFLLAILKAMEQVGGAEALTVVSRLARGEGRLRNDTVLVAAARECLPYLTARAEGRELRDTLLRSSSAAEVAPETLLRPAPGTSEEPANELLRPRE